MNEHVLFIDSRFANVRKSNVEFSVIFNGENEERSIVDSVGGGFPVLGVYNCPGEVFRNVTSVELTSFTISTTNNLSHDATEHYIVMDIDELNSRIVSNVPHVNGTFAVLFYNNNASAGSVQLIKGQDFDQKIRVFDNPLDSLSRLTFKIKAARGYGVPLSWPIDERFEGYFTMIFKIKTKC